MKALAQFTMRGRMQAVLITVLFAALSLILQPLSLLSSAALALVTLRVGAGAGFFVMAVSTGVIALLTQFTMGHPGLALAFTAALWAPVWILAIVLRRTIDLALTTLVGGGLALLLVAGLYTVFGDPAKLWMQVLEQLLQGNEMPAQMGEMQATMAQVLTALSAMVLYFSAMGGLLIGRWWQAMLYNPGGFKKEFLALHIGKWPAWAVVGLSLWAMFAQGGVGTLPTDLAVVALAPFALAGISLVHAWVEYKQSSVWWLVILYVLSFIMLPQVVFTMALVGLSDSWVDWRSRWGGGDAGPKLPERPTDEARPPQAPDEERRDPPRVEDDDQRR